MRITFQRTSDGAPVGELTLTGGQLVAKGAAESIVELARERGESPATIVRKYKNWTNGFFRSFTEVEKRFNPNQPRDPHTGEWIDVPGVGRLTDAAENLKRGAAALADSDKPVARQGMLAALRQSIDNARANGVISDKPKGEGKPFEAPPKLQYVKPALRFDDNSGGVAWEQVARGKANLHITGKGESGTYEIKGDTRRGFSIDSSVLANLPNGLSGKELKNIQELVRDKGGIVHYVEAKDAQDAVAELDALVTAARKRRIREQAANTVPAEFATKELPITSDNIASLNRMYRLFDDYLNGK